MPIGDPMGGEGPIEEVGRLLRVWISCIPVTDLDRAAEFYTGTLGFQLRRRSGNFIELGPSEPTGRIALYVPDKNDARRPGGPTGIILGCDSMYDVHRRLVDEGVVFKLKPERQEWGGLIAIFLDEDGNELTVMEHPGRYE